jgi:RNA polymerase sigma-70 factor (ECF subfamily)
MRLAGSADQPQIELVEPSSAQASATVIERLVAQRHEFLTFLERRLESRALAEDILQEAFARSLAKVEQLESDESAVAWFYRLLRNAVTDYRRRGGVAQRRLEALSQELSAAPEPELQGAVCGCVSSLAQTLKPEYAAALQAVEIQGMPVKDYAESAGITAGNAAVRVFRARAALRLQVKRCCGSCADDNCRDCTCHASAAVP